jgi:hypothetical protein
MDEPLNIRPNKSTWQPYSTPEMHPEKEEDRHYGLFRIISKERIEFRNAICDGDGLIIMPVIRVLRRG